MRTGKNTTKKRNNTGGYWQHLIENFPSHSKVWLEYFDTNSPDLDKKLHDDYFIEKITFERNTKASLKKFSRKYKISVCTVIHGIWGLLLNRYSTADDIMYGTAYFVKGTNEKKISVLKPILPVRSTIYEEETILTYFKEIQDELTKNQKNIKSFAKQAQENNLFNNLFRYLLLCPQKKSTRGKKTAIADLNPKQYPLVLVYDEKPTLKLELWCNGARFSHDSSTNLIEHFFIILNKIISDPDQLVTHYSILTSNEKRELLYEWSKTEYKRLHARKNECVHNLFTQQVKKTPNNLAIAHNETVMTYKQLDELSNQIAHLLIQRKIRYGDTIAVLMERSPLLIATMFAIFKIGAVYVPINPKYADENIKFIIEDSNTHLILVNHTQRIPKEDLYKTVVIDDSYASIKHFPTQLPLAKLDSNERYAYVIYTSGTTGQPKGVIIKHSSLINLTNWYRVCFDISPNDRASQFASQGFDTFFCETIPFLLTGASVHIANDSIKFTPIAFLNWLVEEKITICDLPTAYAQVLLNTPWPDKLNLRTLKLGGEMLAHYPTQSFSFDIWNIYGPAEATIEATYMKIYHANSIPDKKQKHAPPPIGRAIANSEVYVVDQHMELVPIGNVGELLIGGANLSAGYLNRPQLTHDKFVRNIFSNDPDAKVFRTGDLVRWLKDGNLEFVGRIDHQVKISGYRIELTEIETAINQFPDVNEVVVITKELANGEKTLIAYLVPNLDRIRIPYQERCLISINNTRYMQALTEDISKSGVAITGGTEELMIGQIIKLNFKLPGFSETEWLTGKVIWQHRQRAGIQFEETNKQKTLLQKSIEYFLSTHNLMETLHSAAAKRSLRSALKQKLPEYMVPTVFSTLSHLPLTFNGKVDWRLLPPPKDFEKLLERNYAEPRNETEKVIYDIWCDLLNHEKISIIDNFFDLGGNSQLVAELSVRILKKFNVAMPEKILFDIAFIPIMAEYIDSHGKKYTYKSSIQEEIDRDAVLHDDIMPNKVLSESCHKPQGILLTGASGFLGIYLLRELLKNTEAKIYCLIRKGKFESIATRLINNIDQYELSSEISLANRRIVMIESDIGRDQFGINVELYNNLASKIDVIYHCGAQINTVSSYSNLRANNVQGTLEVIKFALKYHDKPIHYISTLAAANKRDEEGHLIEDFCDANASQLVGGYTISKWVSERLLTQLKNRGLPISIYRSGYIWGQSDTGITTMNDKLLLLIKGCIQLKYAPRWNIKVSVLPVDFIAKAIVMLSAQNPEKSHVFHLDHPKGIMWTDLISWLNNYGYPIKLCSHQEWIQHLTTIKHDNALFPFLPHYLAQDTPKKPDIIEMKHTMCALEKANIPYPEMDDTLLRLYLKYLCEIGFFPMPEGKRKQIYI